MASTIKTLLQAGTQSNVRNSLLNTKIIIEQIIESEKKCKKNMAYLEGNITEKNLTDFVK